MGGRGSGLRGRRDNPDLLRWVPPPDPPQEAPTEQADPEREQPDMPGPEPEQASEPDTSTDKDTAGGLETRLRSAYENLSSKPQDWIRLSTLRDKLGNPDRAELDRLLLSMIRTGYVHLAPDSDRKSLTDADHAAAVRIGNQDKHLIAIEPDYPGLPES